MTTMTREALVRWGWENAEHLGIAPSLRLVLLALVELADDDGVYNGGSAPLAQGLHLSPRTVCRALCSLEDRGLIIRRRRYSDTQNVILNWRGRAEASERHAAA